MESRTAAAATNGHVLPPHQQQQQSLAYAQAQQQHQQQIMMQQQMQMQQLQQQQQQLSLHAHAHARSPSAASTTTTPHSAPPSGALPSGSAAASASPIGGSGTTPTSAGTTLAGLSPTPVAALADQPPMKQMRSASYDSSGVPYYSAFAPTPTAHPPWAQPQPHSSWHYSTPPPGPPFMYQPHHPLGVYGGYGAYQGASFPMQMNAPPTMGMVPHSMNPSLAGMPGSGGGDAYSSFRSPSHAQSPPALGVTAVVPTPAATLGGMPNGMNYSCHQCHTTYDEMTLMFCTTQPNGSRKRRCRKKYCHCLQRYYGTKISHLLSTPLSVNTWQCPACLNKCTCVRCRKERDEQDAPCTPKSAGGNTSGAASAGTRKGSTHNTQTVHTPSSTSTTTYGTSMAILAAVVSGQSASDASSVSSDDLPPPEDRKRDSSVTDAATTPTTPRVATTVKKEHVLGARVQVAPLALVTSPGAAATSAEGILAADSTASVSTSPSTGTAPTGATSAQQEAIALDGITLEPGQKCVYILRGLPGSGKSELASQLVRQGNQRVWSSPSLVESPPPPPRTAICSADAFFTDTAGQYHFDARQLGEAHSTCMSAFLRAISIGTPCIIIDNTNTMAWEYRNYLLMADAFKYTCVVYEILCESESTARAMHARQVHRLPLPAHLAMWQRFESDASARRVKPFFGAAVVAAPPEPSSNGAIHESQPARPTTVDRADMGTPPPLSPTKATCTGARTARSAFSAPPITT